MFIFIVIFLPASKRLTKILEARTIQNRPSPKGKFNFKNIMMFNVKGNLLIKMQYICNCFTEYFLFTSHFFRSKYFERLVFVRNSIQ